MYPKLLVVLVGTAILTGFRIVVLALAMTNWLQTHGVQQCGLDGLQLRVREIQLVWLSIWVSKALCLLESDTCV